MRESEERDLLRRLAGERPAAGGRAPAPAGDPSRLAVLWAALEPPPAEPSPPGFSGRVMARVREEEAHRDPLARRFGVRPARFAAASALSAGLIAGAGLGALIATPAAPGAGRAAAVTAEAVDGEGQAEAAPATGLPDARMAGDDAERGVALAARGTASGASGTGGGGATTTDGALDDDALLAAAVAAAAPGEPAGDPDAGFGTEPDLAADYLAALAALEEAS